MLKRALQRPLPLLTAFGRLGLPMSLRFDYRGSAVHPLQVCVAGDICYGALRVVAYLLHVVDNIYIYMPSMHKRCHSSLPS